MTNRQHMSIAQAMIVGAGLKCRRILTLAEVAELQKPAPGTVSLAPAPESSLMEREVIALRCILADEGYEVGPYVGVDRPLYSKRLAHEPQAPREPARDALRWQTCIRFGFPYFNCNPEKVGDGEWIICANGNEYEASSPSEAVDRLLDALSPGQSHQERTAKPGSET